VHVHRRHTTLRHPLTSCLSDIAKQRPLCRLPLLKWFGLGRVPISTNISASTSHTNLDSVAFNDAMSSVFWRILDSELTRKHHVTRSAAAGFYHIRHLRQVRRHVGQEVTQQLVVALIMSRLGHWNSICWQDCQCPHRSHCSVSRMLPLDWCTWNRSHWPRHAEPHPALLAASQIQSKVQTLLSNARYLLWS